MSLCVFMASVFLCLRGLQLWSRSSVHYRVSSFVEFTNEHLDHTCWSCQRATVKANRVLEREGDCVRVAAQIRTPEVVYFVPRSFKPLKSSNCNRQPNRLGGKGEQRAEQNEIALSVCNLCLMNYFRPSVN